MSIIKYNMSNVILFIKLKTTKKNLNQEINKLYYF